MRAAGPSVESYIRSIGRHYINAVIIMSLLIGATHFTITIALDRHALQQNISFLTSNRFIRFQQLANQTRALMRASADPNLPEYIIMPMQEDIRAAIVDIHEMNDQIDALYEKVGQNLLERLNRRDDAADAVRAELALRLDDFLERAERVVETSTRERRDRYSFWGPIDFAVSSDGVLIRLFGEVIRHAHARSDTSIGNAKFIGTVLLALIAATLALASLFLFGPLLRKLSHEHRKTVDFENRLRELAHTDSLTGLANRSAFSAALGDLFGALEREGRGFSMLLLDLDHFKVINDTYGHPAGDAVLGHVAAAIQRTFRAGDIAARIGGDEFVVLLPEIVDKTALDIIAQRAVKEIASDLVFEGRTLHVSASVGGAIVPDHAADEAGLIRVTDLALYAAKARRNTAVIFDEASLAQQLEQNRLAGALSQAIERDEFVVHYQPKVCLRTGAQVGFEALVRWAHPEQGLLAPGRFLPLMGPEHFADMTQAIARTVARDLRSWRDAGLVSGPVAINLPEALLVSTKGYELLEQAIETNGLSWQDFSVEMTEDVFLNRNAAQIRSALTRFQKQGLTVALDDFGTGFASLVHLRDFPFDELKIDGSFIAVIGKDSSGEQIIRAMIDLARNLGKRCVAEGIETEEQYRFLLAAGCEIGQGYLFSKPVPADMATEQMRRAPGAAATPWARAIAAKPLELGASG